MASPRGFSTEGIRFVEDSYEAYLESVEKVMKEPFENSDVELLRVPPVYRERMIAHLQDNYPQYKIQKYEISGIAITGDLPACLRYSIHRVKAGDGVIKTEFLDEVCAGLQKEFPSRKFEIQENEEIYAGTSWMGKKNPGQQIVVDDFEIQGKWGPTTHRSGDLDWLLEESLEEIKIGHRVFDTNKDEELVVALREKCPGHTFELRKHDELFPWNTRSKKYCSGRNYETVIVMDGFVPPPPKKYLKEKSLISNALTWLF